MCSIPELPYPYVWISETYEELLKLGHKMDPIQTTLHQPYTIQFADVSHLLLSSLLKPVAAEPPIDKDAKTR
jgi:hypothetical protein